MKAYTVKQNRYDFYNGQLIDAVVLGYYTKRATADKVAEEHKQDTYHTVGNAYVEEITINED